LVYTGKISNSSKVIFNSLATHTVLGIFSIFSNFDRVDASNRLDSTLFKIEKTLFWICRSQLKASADARQIFDPTRSEGFPVPRLLLPARARLPATLFVLIVSLKHRHPGHHHRLDSCSPSKIWGEIIIPLASRHAFWSQCRIWVVVDAGQAGSPSPSPRLSVDRLLLVMFFVPVDWVMDCRNESCQMVLGSTATKISVVWFSLIFLVRCNFVLFGSPTMRNVVKSN
jgi:hypothetical protein